MHSTQPIHLSSIQQVAAYWRSCLVELEAGVDDSTVAAHMVGVISNEYDDLWSTISPAYAQIFELAASLELPNASPEYRRQAWDCIRALLKVLELV